MKCYRGLHHQGADETSSGFFAFLTVPPGAAVPRAPAREEDVRRSSGATRVRSRRPNRCFEPIRGVPQAGARCASGPFRFRCFRACSIRSTRRACSGTGRPTSSRSCSDEAIAEHVKHGATLPTMHSTMHLYPVNGAAHRVDERDTPWSYRDAKWAQVIVGVDPDPANKDKISALGARTTGRAASRTRAGGAYVNFMMEEGEDRVRATYGKNYDRLAKIKKRVRSGEPVPREPEHQARESRVGLTACQASDRIVWAWPLDLSFLSSAR